MKHWTKLFVALAASAAFASLVAALAVASGAKAGGARVAIERAATASGRGSVRRLAGAGLADRASR